ncbi:MAG: ABC transporter ATP-binding protein [Acidimicrobiales bacterium]|nr:ABC transporter ATP-binding protein [Acidimicrobiales bacterium]
MAQVQLQGVTKRFGNAVAVDDLNLDIADHEFLVLLGPSGCGKTTALRMIAGLDEPTSGTITIGDDVVNGLDPSERDIAMVFQSYALYPNLTVAANIEAPLMARRRDVVTGEKVARPTSAQRRTQVEEAAALLGLSEQLDKKPGELSGGQRQRVALARAMVRHPRAFLMDEPLSNLDAKLRTQTRVELVELWRRLESTFIYVTHDQVEAMTMATRVAIMSAGKLQQVGPPQEVYDRPANLFVAEFIGSPPMNILPAELSRGDSGLAIKIAGSVIDVPTKEDLASGASGITIGIRPEHVEIDPTGDIDATVRSVELLGHEQHVVVAVDGNDLVIRQSVAADQPAPGAQINLKFERQHLHVFDSSSTQRLFTLGDLA